MPFQYFSRYILGLGVPLRHPTKKGWKQPSVARFCTASFTKCFLPLTAKEKISGHGVSRVARFDHSAAKAGSTSGTPARVRLARDLDTLYEPEERLKNFDAENEQGDRDKAALFEEEFDAVRITEPSPDDERALLPHPREDRSYDTDGDSSFFTVTDYKTPVRAI
jgi:hypothetical protein